MVFLLMGHLLHIFITRMSRAEIGSSIAHAR
jgi:hypothetical protein